MTNEFDPKKIIDFEKDYYGILGLQKLDFPIGKSRAEVIKTSEILEKAFRVKARKCHPDFGGSNEAFLDIVRARRILEDPLLRKIYDQGFFEEYLVAEENDSFKVDWAKIGTYRKGTPEDTIGFSLFLKLCENKNNLGLVPAFFPTTNEHNYEWDFVIEGQEKTKLVISIVNDENEVLRLTSNEDVEKALPFKIYICIPKANLVFIREENSVLTPDGKTLVNGNITKAGYNDLDLLETTNLNSANKYVEEQLLKDLVKFKNGELKPSIKTNQAKMMDSEEMKKFDKDKLSEILNIRKFIFDNDEKASEFLDNIENKRPVFKKSAKPELPF
jgi:curved DNA-binding protein CbpA